MADAAGKTPEPLETVAVDWQAHEPVSPAQRAHITYLWNRGYDK